MMLRHFDSEEQVKPYPMRLNKFLARAGVASRRKSDELIAAGRVSVNGDVTCDLGRKVNPHEDEVCVDGEAVKLTDGPVYIMLHKPAGYVTTMADPHGDRIVADLVPLDRFPGLFPVGRLDMDTTGLLLFTTDGDLSQALLHPKYHVEKTYRAVVEGVPTEEELDSLRRGIELDDGPTKPARVKLVKRGKDASAHHGTSVVDITLTEGRKRQVKRMLTAVHHSVVSLHRKQFGPLKLEGLAQGAWRELTPAEVAALKEAAGVSGVV